MSDESRTTIVLAKDITLTGMSSMVSLQSAAESIDIPSALSDTTSSPSLRAVLILTKIDVEKQPGASIVFDLVSNTNGERRQIGSLNFFALDEAGHDHDEADKTPDGLTFDVTNTLAELGVDGLEAVSLDIRALNLVPPEEIVRAAAEQLGAESQAETPDATSTLETLRNMSLGDFAETIEEINRESSAALQGSEALTTEKDTETAQERVENANITIGEIVLSFGS